MISVKETPQSRLQRNVRKPQFTNLYMYPGITLDYPSLTLSRNSGYFEFGIHLRPHQLGSVIQLNYLMSKMSWSLNGQGNLSFSANSCLSKHFLVKLLYSET